jgi:death-on-curing protein
MRYLTLGEVVELHRLVLAASGGATGIRDLGALESAVAQPRASFGGSDLHPTLIEKTGALGFALAQGHPFVDGNKRVALRWRRSSSSTTPTSRLRWMNKSS